MTAKFTGYFDESFCGLHADEAFGHQHIRDTLANLLEEVSGGDEDSVVSLTRELRDEPSDDFSEEDDALELLQANTADGLIWVIDGGLVLRVDEEECDDGCLPHAPDCDGFCDHLPGHHNACLEDPGFKPPVAVRS